MEVRPHLCRTHTSRGTWQQRHEQRTFPASPRGFFTLTFISPIRRGGLGGPRCARSPGERLVPSARPFPHIALPIRPALPSSTASGQKHRNKTPRDLHFNASEPLSSPLLQRAGRPRSLLLLVKNAEDEELGRHSENLCHSGISVENRLERQTDAPRGLNPKCWVVKLSWSRETGGFGVRAVLEVPQDQQQSQPAPGSSSWSAPASPGEDVRS